MLEFTYYNTKKLDNLNACIFFHIPNKKFRL